MVETETQWKSKAGYQSTFDGATRQADAGTMNELAGLCPAAVDSG